MYVDRKNLPSGPKVEMEIDENTSVEYIKSRSRNCERQRLGILLRPNRGDCDENRDNEHRRGRIGWGKVKHLVKLPNVLRHPQTNARN